MENKKYGLIIDRFQEGNYVLGSGSIGTKEIQPNGQWDNFLPTNEIQWKYTFDTYNCTAFGTLNVIETIFNKVYYETKNFSDRFVGIMSGTQKSGNSPHTVAEAIRKFGLINDVDLPFSEDIDTWDKYFSPWPMYPHLIEKGKNFLENYDIKHEWVFDFGGIFKPSKQVKVDKIKEALKRSPVGMSVAAWSDPNDDGIYTQDSRDNHWVMCYGYDELKQAWKIFDSYDNTKKLYSMDSDIVLAKLYWIEKKVKSEFAFNIYWTKIFNLIKNFISPVTTISDMKVITFCKAIQDFEGWRETPPSRSFRNKNPGNLKYCGQQLSIGKDAQGFAIFKTYEDGFNTLTNMVKSAASGNSNVYSPNDTLLEFFKKYAPSSDNNNPFNYAVYVAKQIGGDINMEIKNLIL